MNRRILDVSNLVEAIENGMLSVTNVKSKMKSYTDNAETENVFPEKFLESLQHLNEAKLFKNGIDFYYEFSGKNGVHIDVAMKNPFMNEYFYVECEIMDGFLIDDVDKKLGGNTSDRMDV